MARVAEKARGSAESAKAVICELLAAAGGTLSGKVRLNKAFYFAHLYYWRDAAGVLTDYPIVRMPFGPGINAGSDLLGELEEAGVLEITTQPNGPYQEYVYRLLRDVHLEPDTPRTEAIREAITLVKGRTAVELSELTHDYSRSWQTTPDGTEMDIYADLLSDEEFEAARAAVQRIKSLA